jgi:hypothetical protein
VPACATITIAATRESAATARATFTGESVVGVAASAAGRSTESVAARATIAVIRDATGPTRVTGHVAVPSGPAVAEPPTASTTVGVSRCSVDAVADQYSLAAKFLPEGVQRVVPLNGEVAEKGRSVDPVLIPLVTRQVQLSVEIRNRRIRRRRKRIRRS